MTLYADGVGWPQTVGLRGAVRAVENQKMNPTPKQWTDAYRARFEDDSGLGVAAAEYVRKFGGNAAEIIADIERQELAEAAQTAPSEPVETDEQFYARLAASKARREAAQKAQDEAERNRFNADRASGWQE